MVALFVGGVSRRCGFAALQPVCLYGVWKYLRIAATLSRLKKFEDLLRILRILPWGSGGRSPPEYRGSVGPQPPRIKGGLGGGCPPVLDGGSGERQRPRSRRLKSSKLPAKAQPGTRCTCPNLNNLLLSQCLTSNNRRQAITRLAVHCATQARPAQPCLSRPSSSATSV